ncbi:Arc-like DNA binding domain-containing protein [Roseovarius pacificus]|uniref:Arc-like DNA binding domain-containing protein n=1 Tax=Roseovarius pacificus TaxID=337701 RepID=A0A1M7BJC2_9RHOB|nr:Arc family DNA-binding protein [Roseovarius pacificus]GGO55189.1 hypothetical protein GCM10011315_17140 [Roseovarius pacificus]SHL55080.1 Arc-like DNA binding domain-containing protein [Roseovarius pacificus]
MSKIRQLPVRFPLDVKTWLAEQAAKNGSSQNSEVIRAVRERMDRTTYQPNQEEVSDATP